MGNYVEYVTPIKTMYNQNTELIAYRNEEGGIVLSESIPTGDYLLNAGYDDLQTWIDECDAISFKLVTHQDGDTAEDFYAIAKARNLLKCQKVMDGNSEIAHPVYYFKGNVGYHKEHEAGYQTITEQTARDGA